MADSLEGCAAIQRDLDHLERWADKNLIKFKKKKEFSVLYMGRNSPRNHYLLRATQLENSSEEKDLEVLVDTKLNVSQQCAKFLDALGKVSPAGQER